MAEFSTRTPHVHPTTERRPRVKRGFGEIEKLPSGRFRARYSGPDLRRHSAPITFETRLDAETWLVDERRLIASGDWLPPNLPGVSQPTSDLTFGEYAETWLAERPTKPRTHERYNADAQVRRRSPALQSMGVLRGRPGELRLARRPVTAATAQTSWP